MVNHLELDVRQKVVYWVRGLHLLEARQEDSLVVAAVDEGVGSLTESANSGQLDGAIFVVQNVRLLHADGAPLDSARVQGRHIVDLECYVLDAVAVCCDVLVHLLGSEGLVCVGLVL